MVSRLCACLMGIVATLLRLSAQTQEVQPLLDDLHGDTSYPALSHDGKTLAFVWCGPDGEKCGIYLRGFQSTKSARLLVGEDEKGGFPVALAWAPDGKSLAFTRYYSHSAVRLSVVNVDPPGRERSLGWLCDHGYQPEFSAGGRSIVAAVPADGLSVASGCSAITLSPQTGKRVRTLAARGVSPRFSPDGQTLAYADDRSLKILKVNDSAARTTTLATEPRMIEAIRWSPDGRSILYEVRGDVWFLRRVRLNGTSPETVPESTARRFSLSQVLSDGRLLGTAGRDGSRERSVTSPDGRLRAFINTRSGYYEIWLHESETGLERPILRKIPTFPDDEAVPDLISWSPDGKQILFATTASRAHGDPRHHIYVVPFTRSGESQARRLGADAKALYCKTWSPDSRTIYCEQPPDEQLKAVDVTDGAVRDLGVQGTFPMASPDGMFLYYLFVSGPGSRQLVRTRLNTRSQPEVMTGTGDLFLVAVDNERVYLNRGHEVTEVLDLKTRRSTVTPIPKSGQVLSRQKAVVLTTKP
jgi:Tol biopolymer transport system component